MVHNRIVLSSLPDASSLPSDLNARLVIVFAWAAIGGRTSFPVLSTQSRMSPSRQLLCSALNFPQLAEAMIPSELIATSLIHPA
jgi:hypothetical protein